MIPVSASDSDSVEAVVPAFTSATSGAFTAETVDVQVVEFSSSTTYLSNRITGLQVSALPPLPGGVPAGAMTVALPSSALNISGATQRSQTGNANFPARRQALTQFNADLASLVSGANTVVNDPAQTVILTTANGTTTSLNAQTLAMSDQLA